MISFRPGLVLFAEWNSAAPPRWHAAHGSRKVGLNYLTMQIDWITWSVFGIGLALLVYWCVQTVREFKELFKQRSTRSHHD